MGTRAAAGLRVQHTTPGWSAARKCGCFVPAAEHQCRHCKWAEAHAQQTQECALFSAQAQPFTAVGDSGLWKTVLRLVHGHAEAGHFGITKTLHFYWPGCHMNANLYVNRCNMCTVQKGRHSVHMRF